MSRSLDGYDLRADEGGLVEVRLDAPGTRNAVTDEMADVLHRAMDVVVRDARPGLLLTSALGVFSAGTDLRGLDEAGDEVLRERFRRVQSVLDRIVDLPALTIAVLDGPALGAGADLALACEHRIATPSASLRFPGPQFGLLLGTMRLAALVGAARAQRILLTSEALDAEGALALGLVTDLVADAGTARGRAEELTAGPAASVVDLGELVAATRGAAAHARPLERSMKPGLADRMRAYVATRQQHRR